MQLVKTGHAAWIVAAMLACTCALAGCAGEAVTQEAAASVDASAASARSIVILGSQADAADGVVLENALGDYIERVTVGVSGSKDDPASLSIAGAWGDGADAILFIPQSCASVPCDLTFTVGKKQYVLHDVDFTHFQVGRVCLEGDMAYLSFLPADAALNTLEHEQYLVAKADAAKKAKEAKAAKKKAEKAEEEARAANEAAAQANAQAEAAWAQSQAVYYEEPAAEAAPAANAGDGGAA